MPDNDGFLREQLVQLLRGGNAHVDVLSALKGFTEVVVLTSTRGQKMAEAAPTAANIRAQLKRLLKRVTKHDMIVVALAGHGLQLKIKQVHDEDEQKLYLFDAKKVMAPTFGSVRGKKLGEVVSAGPEGLRIHAQGGFIEASRLRLGDGAKVKSTELAIPVGTILGG